MPRTTLNDRTRKQRIRAREYNKLRRQMIKLESITDAQIAILKKIEAVMEKGQLPTTQDIPDWEALREMGVIRLDGDQVILTSVGGDVLDAEEA